MDYRVTFNLNVNKLSLNRIVFFLQKFDMNEKRECALRNDLLKIGLKLKCLKNEIESETG